MIVKQSGRFQAQVQTAHLGTFGSAVEAAVAVARHIGAGGCAGAAPVGTVDARLWAGAEAAGWHVHEERPQHYLYVAPDGRRFSSRKAAREAAEAEAGEGEEEEEEQQQDEDEEEAEAEDDEDGEEEDEEDGEEEAEAAAAAAAAEDEEEEAAEEEEEVAVEAEGLRLHLSAKSKSGYRGVSVIGKRYQAGPLATRPRPRVRGATTTAIPPNSADAITPRRAGAGTRQWPPRHVRSCRGCCALLRTPRARARPRATAAAAAAAAAAAPSRSMPGPYLRAHRAARGGGGGGGAAGGPVPLSTTP